MMILEHKVRIDEDLSAKDVAEIKELVRTMLQKLFYTLYVKKMFLP